jgi:hypothetical protein
MSDASGERHDGPADDGVLMPSVSGSIHRQKEKRGHDSEGRRRFMKLLVMIVTTGASLTQIIDFIDRRMERPGSATAPAGDTAQTTRASAKLVGEGLVTAKADAITVTESLDVKVIRAPRLG